MKLAELNVAEFNALLASDAPAPGGGSAAALEGAIGAALTAMVCGLTKGKKKFAEFNDLAVEAEAKALALKDRFVDVMDRDTEAFNVVSAAFGMPKATDEEKAARSAAMQEGLKAAARVPLGVAQTIDTLFPALEKAVTIGNPNAVTDGMVGTMLARTGILGALFNVRVNLESIKDEAFVAELSAETDKLQKSATEWERKILSQVKLARI